MSGFDPFATTASTFVTVFVLMLGLAGLVMPLYVIGLHGLVKRLLKKMETLEKLEWYAQKANERAVQEMAQRSLDGPGRERLR